MKHWLVLLTLIATAHAEKLATLQIEATGAPAIALRGKDARQQLLVTGKLDTNAERDFTHKATYQAAPAGIVNVDANGLIAPVADGTATITATADGVAATIEVKVENAASNPPVNFANQVVPIFTKATCNSGGCHGKIGRAHV